MWKVIKAIGEAQLWLNYMFPKKGHIVESRRQYKERNPITISWAAVKAIFAVGVLLIIILSEYKKISNEELLHPKYIAPAPPTQTSIPLEDRDTISILSKDESLKESSSRSTSPADDTSKRRERILRDQVF